MKILDIVIALDDKMSKLYEHLDITHLETTKKLQEQINILKREVKELKKEDKE